MAQFNLFKDLESRTGVLKKKEFCLGVATLAPARHFRLSQWSVQPASPSSKLIPCNKSLDIYKDSVSLEYKIIDLDQLTPTTEEGIIATDRDPQDHPEVQKQT